MGITIYLRYRQIEQLLQHHPDLGSNICQLNKKAVWFGFASCLGISVVGNFQETNVRIVHLIGAFCCFGCGTVYFWLQAVISYLTKCVIRGPQYAYMRVAMSIICTILFILLFTTGIMSHILFKGQNPRKWYLYLIVSQIPCT